MASSGYTQMLTKVVFFVFSILCRLTLGDLVSSIEAMADHLLVALRGLKSRSWLGAVLPMLVRAGSLPRRTIRVEPSEGRKENHQLVQQFREGNLHLHGMVPPTFLPVTPPILSMWDFGNSGYLLHLSAVCYIHQPPLHHCLQQWLGFRSCMLLLAEITFTDVWPDLPTFATMTFAFNILWYGWLLHFPPEAHMSWVSVSKLKQTTAEQKH